MSYNYGIQLNGQNAFIYASIINYYLPNLLNILFKSKIKETGDFGIQCNYGHLECFGNSSEIYAFNLEFVLIPENIFNKYNYDRYYFYNKPEINIKCLKKIYSEIERYLIRIGLNINSKTCITKCKKCDKYISSLISTKKVFCENCLKTSTKEIIKNPGYTYIIKMNDFFKIGATTNYKKRIKSFSMLPGKIETIFILDTDSMYQTENELHNKFSEKRLKGEWFKLDEKDLKIIEDKYRKLIIYPKDTRGEKCF